MSQPVVFTWPNAAENFQNIADTQLVEPGKYVSLVTNGYCPSQYAYGDPLKTNAFIMPNMIRTLQIYSSGNEVNADLLITGLGFVYQDTGDFGPLEVITETISGIEAGSVYTETAFSVIYSIQNTGTAITPGISIGYGTNGYTSLFFLDGNRKMFQLGTQIYFPNGADSDSSFVTIFHSIPKPEIISTFSSLTPQPAFFGMPIEGLSNVTIDLLLSDQIPCSVAWAEVGNNTTADIYISFLQQGIT